MIRRRSLSSSARVSSSSRLFWSSVAEMGVVPVVNKVFAGGSVAAEPVTVVAEEAKGVLGVFPLPSLSKVSRAGNRK